MQAANVARQAGVAQRPVEADASDLDGKNGLLPSTGAQLERYIIHRKLGLIHVMRFRSHVEGKRPSRTAVAPDFGAYAW